MSKIVVFLGSPRKNGISIRIIDSVIDGAKSLGADVSVYDLNDSNMRGCQACDYCRKNEGCAVKDNLMPMYDDIKIADGIVTSFPIYMRDVNSQSKMWLDRLRPFFNSDFSPRNPGKKIVSVFTQGNPNAEIFKPSIDKTNAIFSGFFMWELVDSLLAYGTAVPSYVIPEDIINRAFEAGKKLVS